jgi:DNA-binding SARP family transcriptional activator/DNA-binding CsgD family transcriptional regulator/tetratricopeptide (TPR) repeat protein
MEIWVLGTLEVSHDGRALDVRGPLPRRLLAMLALTPGSEVSADRLVDALWGDSPPAAASATLQSHVARLRRDLPSPDLVRTGRQGYVLDVDPDDVDAFALERQVAAGSKALLDGQVEEASSVLGDALNLWRGTPYAEFSDCAPLESEAERLCALRLDALERRISADLGRPGAAPPIAELEALVRWHPLRESFWALLMCAQYRVGRQGDALASYQRARATLADELGVDPGPQLQELERLVLAQDPSLELSGMSTFLPSRSDRGAYPEVVALVERASLLEALTALHDDALAGSGRLALVHGEAGVGKSALVRAWSAAAGSRARVLCGACDPLSSPRPLGPLVDVAPQLDPQVAELLRSGERDGLFEATLVSLEAGGPTVLVIEDLHWADMSTLDLMRFLARRLGGTTTLVVATYRDEHLRPSDPLRVMLGDIASQSVVRRLDVPLLSPDAVAELAAGSGVDPEALYRETGGNAFFVTEVVASGGQHLPATVQDAVLARVHRLSPQARLALESAAVIGSRVEPALVHGMPDVTADAVDECVTAGMLRFDAPTYAFRHELVRQSVLSGVTPGRLGALHWQALDRLRVMPMSPRPFARLAEHAEMAGDGPAILEFAVAAGDSAARLGSHREAAFQYGRAVAHADLLDTDARIELLSKRAYECQVNDDHEHAIEAWDQALRLLRGTGRQLEVVDALMGLDESYYTIGDNSHGTEFVDEAFVLLDGTEPTRQLAAILARRGTHLLRASETVESVPWLTRGVEMARLVGDAVVAARAGANLGVAHYLLGERTTGIEEVNEALRTALDHDEEEMAGRIYQTVAGLAWLELDLVEAHERMEEAERYTADHDLNGHLMCVLATEITWKLDLGRWDEAMAQAHDLLYVRNTGRASRIEPLMAIGLLGARRGDRDDVWAHLDEARDYIAKTQTLGYQGFVALARGEAYLLAGDVEAIRAEVLPWYDESVRLWDEEVLNDLVLLVWRAGLIDAAPDGLREPEVLSMTGRHREAATMWTTAGAPYKAAWALLDSDDEVDLREARAMFDRLGAAVLVERTDAKLRSIGARVPRGARASTRANVGGLTDREVDVLDLLDEGLRNAEIAQRLHLSEKTVGHHVSAILAKLGASSRLEAVRRARDLTAVS